MLANETSILGRLQRGRGDAIRELLQCDQPDAWRVLRACLLDDSNGKDLLSHVHGYADLVLAIDPPLDDWYRFLEGLPKSPDDAPSSDVLSATVMFGFSLLAELVRRGHVKSHSFLSRYLVGGSNWRHALDAAEADAVGVDLMRRLVDRMTDSEIGHYIDLASSVWKLLIATDERVRRIAAHPGLPEQRYDACTLQDYSSAPTSQARWKILQRLMVLSPNASADLLEEGLWDASPSFRARCIAYVDLMRPGVMDRVRGLTHSSEVGVRDAARRRLAKEGIE